MNINNYFGEHKSRLAPVLMFLLVAAAPLMLYAVVLVAYIPWKVMLCFEIPWAIRWALIIPGQEKKRIAAYIQQAEDEYASANELANIVQVTDDGMIERTNGTIAYIVSGFAATYIDDNSFTLDMEAFISQLKGLNYDTYCFQVTDEVLLQNELEKLTVYTDDRIIKERMSFYEEQDEYCQKNGSLYRIVFLVKGSRYEWKALRKRLESLVNSEDARVFKSCKIYNGEQVEDIMSRDTCTNMRIRQMLVDKHDNNQYYGSRVLYYGKEVPEELKGEKEEVSLQSRRVVLREEGE